MTQWILIGTLVLIVIPVGIYLSVKLATWAYLKAHHDFDEQYNHNHSKEKD